MKLLLVDEDEEEMPQLVDELRLEGHEVQQALNCEQLESAMVGMVFDGLILDLMMPAIDGIPPDKSDFGYTAGVYLYESAIAPRWPNVPFIVVSAVDPETSVFKRAIERLRKHSGFRGHVEKPPEVERIIQLLCNPHSGAANGVD